MRGYELDDALRLIGVARRRSALELLLPALGLLAAGAAIGAGIGLAFAPSSGRRLREDVGGRLDQIRERVKKESEKHSNASVTSTPTLATARTAESGREESASQAALLSSPSLSKFALGSRAATRPAP